MRVTKSPDADEGYPRRRTIKRDRVIPQRMLILWKEAASPKSDIH